MCRGKTASNSGKIRDRSGTDPGGNHRRGVDPVMSGQNCGPCRARLLRGRPAQWRALQPLRHAGRAPVPLCHAGAGQQYGRRQCRRGTGAPGRSLATGIVMASLISESRAGMAFLRRLIPTSLLATDVAFCFCDPQTPCQCGSNETISGPFGNIYGGAAWAFQACPATIPVQWL